MDAGMAESGYPERLVRALQRLLALEHLQLRLVLITHGHMVSMFQLAACGWELVGCSECGLQCCSHPGMHRTMWAACKPSSAAGLRRSLPTTKTSTNMSQVRALCVPAALPHALDTDQTSVLWCRAVRLRVRWLLPVWLDRLSTCLTCCSTAGTMPTSRARPSCGSIPSPLAALSPCPA